VSFIDLLIVCITLFSTPLRGIRLSLCPSLSDHYMVIPLRDKELESGVWIYFLTTLLILMEDQ